VRTLPTEIDGLSHAEIAAKLGMHKDAVYRIEKRAMQKAREICRRNGWKAQDFYGALRAP